MIGAEKVILRIGRGAKCIYDKEGFYDIWVYMKDCSLVAAIRDNDAEEVVFEDLPILCMNTDAPFVTIQLPEER